MAEEQKEEKTKEEQEAEKKEPATPATNPPKEEPKKVQEEVKDEPKEEKKEEPKEEKKEELKEKPKEEKKKEPVKVPEKFKKLIAEIEKMTVLDLAELVKILEKKFGVSAATPVAVAAASAAGAPGAAPEAEEKSVFNIELKEVGEKKIEVIKAVRDITQKGLKESKDLVDAVATGSQVIKENVKKEEAEEMKKKLETAGAKVELK